MKKVPLKLGDKSKRAVVDTVSTILEEKGHEVFSVSPTDTVYEAIAAMARHQVGALVVLSGSNLVGIVSERDYARKVILSSRSSRDTLVEQIMTPAPVTVALSHTVDACLRIMNAKRIRHLPVLDEGELKGMISIGDLVKTMISSQAYTIDQLHSYIEIDYPS